MKRALSLVLCLVIGYAMGWFVEYEWPTGEDRRYIIKNAPYLERELREGIDAMNKMELQARKDSEKDAKPWRESTASIALLALKSLNTNDIDSAKTRLAALVATYYRQRSPDDDTNLVARIEAFAGTDKVLYNAIYKK